MKRTCKKCGITKNISAFPTRKAPNGVQYRRHTCGNCRSQGWRRRHPEKRSIISKRGKQKYRKNSISLKEQLLNHIGQTSCIKCGEKNILALAFHHINPKEKNFDIKYGFTHSYSFYKLKKEAEKCTILCHNCHSLEHRVFSKRSEEHFSFKKEILEKLGKTECERCGVSNIRILSFHHTGKKTIKMSEAIRDKIDINTILAEAASCQILCLNCHFAHHRKVNSPQF